MVTKLKKTNTASKATPSKASSKKSALPLAGSVKDSAQQIWQAGLGAFTRAQAEGSKSGDTYTVTFTSKNPGEGKAVPFGIAIHGDHASGRFHHVSLGYTLGVGADGDVKALKQ